MTRLFAPGLVALAIAAAFASGGSSNSTPAYAQNFPNPALTSTPRPTPPIDAILTNPNFLVERAEEDYVSVWNAIYTSEIVYESLEAHFNPYSKDKDGEALPTSFTSSYQFKQYSPSGVPLIMRFNSLNSNGRFDLFFSSMEPNSFLLLYTNGSETYQYGQYDRNLCSPQSGKKAFAYKRLADNFEAGYRIDKNLLIEIMEGSRGHCNNAKG